MFNALKPKALVALFAITAVLLVTVLACGASATAVPQIKEVIKEVEVIKEIVKEVEVTPVPAAKKTIIFSDLNWSSAELQTRIAQYIVEHGYGYPVDAILGDTISMQVGLSQGDTHVSMEIWLPNQQVWWDKQIKEGGVIPVGKSLDDNWQSAFVVPTYVVEQNPGLKSVFDLPDHMDLFVTPESDGKALLVGCVIGWACEIHNELQVKAYGLEDVIKIQNVGAQAALDAHITGSYEKGEPALFYYWGPTKIAADLDLTPLEEPAYSDACWEGDKGCAYSLARVLIAVHPSLIQRAPDVVEMLRKWDYTAAAQVAAEGWMAENEATSAEAAINFLKNHDVWQKWVTDDAAAMVTAALAKE